MIEMHRVEGTGEQHQSAPQTLPRDALIEKVTASYKSWLTTQTRQHSQAMAQEMLDYAERAMQAVEVQEKRIQTFAPFRYKYSALQTITRKQKWLLLVLALGWMVILLLNWRFTVAATITVITIGYLAHLFLDGYLAIQATRHDAEEQIDGTLIDALKDADWPPYTILCPLYKEAQIVPQFVAAMKALDYPADKLQILFLTEEDDADTRKAILSLHLPGHFKVVTVPDGSPRTKPRACNYGLIEASGLYVVIYDAEDVPDPLQLKKAVLTFANHGPDLACVQAKLNFYNPQQNILTRWFTAEYSLWFDLILPGLQKGGLAIPLGGTSNHFPVQTLRALGAWDAFNVTEDCDLGLRLSWFHLKTVIVNSTTLEEANSRLKNWIRQRSRWIKGYMQTYLVHMREPAHYIRQKRFRELFSLQVVIGGRSAFLLINPLMWLFLIVGLILGKSFQHAYTALLPSWALEVGLVTLILGNFFYGYSYLLGCMKREQYALVKWMLLIPVYWALSSAAAYMALYELFTKPHYWQKTIHGLHLNKTQQDQSTQVAEAADPEWETIAQLAEHLTPLSSTKEHMLEHGAGTANQLQHYEKLENVPVPSVQDSVEMMISHHHPALLPSERALLEKTMRVKRDFWLLATMLTSVVLSVVAFIAFERLHVLSSLFSAQAGSRMPTLLEFDILRAGATNLWLPLPQLAVNFFILLFSWNENLRQLAVASSIPAMAGYIVTSIYLYLTMRLLTGNRILAYLCVLIFVLNPAVLYFQSASASLLMTCAAVTMTSYYLLAWMRNQHLGNLLELAGSIFLATLCSYTAWALFLGLLLLIPFVGICKRQKHTHLVSNLLIFGIPGSLGIGLWTGWNWYTMGSPFPFLNGLTTTLSPATHALTTHTFWSAMSFLGQAAFEVSGPLVLIAIPGIVVYLVQRWRSLDILYLLAVLLPIVVTLACLYSGLYSFASTTAIPAAWQASLLQLQLGVELVVPVAVLVAMMLSILFSSHLPFGEDGGR